MVMVVLLVVVMVVGVISDDAGERDDAGGDYSGNIDGGSYNH